MDELIYRTLRRIDEDSFDLQKKILFFKELGFLLQWGVGVADALASLYHNSDNFAVKTIAEDMLIHINAWKSFSYAISRQPKFFDETDSAILKAAEKTWELAKILTLLAKEYAFLATVTNEAKSALTYPVVLIVIAFSAVIALFVFVLPGIFSIYEQFPNVDLPWTTQILQAISSSLINHRKGLLIWGWLGLVVFSIFLSTPQGQKISYRVLYHTPVLDKIIQAFYLIKISRYAKILLNAWLNYVQTFAMIKQIINHAFFDDFFRDVQRVVSTGQQLVSWLQLHPDIFPTTVTALIAVWEQTANVANSFDAALEMYEEELRTSIKSISKLIEPLLMVIIWGLIVMIALGVYGVIMNIMDVVQV